jgi:hypothetical protein
MLGEDLMKKLKDNTGQKAQRPPRAEVSEKEALKRMQEFPKRKASFVASVRAVKG